LNEHKKRFSLDGKTAVVSGGLGLIGKKISTALLQASAKVLILDINENKGKKIKRENIEFIKFDLTKIEKYPSKLKELHSKYGPIHIWINTAYPRTNDWGEKLEKIKVKSWKKNVDIHLNSYCLLTRDVAEYMKKNKVKGSIINFGSIYGIIGPDFSIYDKTDMTMPAAYSAIKGGIISFSRYVATYYAEYKIRINVISPGGIFDNQDESFVKKYEEKTPMKRMGTPDDITGPVVFLASDSSSYITGHNLIVDGGWTIL